jgi:hypothetical protein
VNGFESHTNSRIENGSQQAIVLGFRSRRDVGTQTLYERDVCQPVDNQIRRGHRLCHLGRNHIYSLAQCHSLQSTQPEAVPIPFPIRSLAKFIVNDES